MTGSWKSSGSSMGGITSGVITNPEVVPTRTLKTLKQRVTQEKNNKTVAVTPIQSAPPTRVNSQPQTFTVMESLRYLCHPFQPRLSPLSFQITQVKGLILLLRRTSQRSWKIIWSSLNKNCSGISVYT